MRRRRRRGHQPCVHAWVQHMPVCMHACTRASPLPRPRALFAFYFAVRAPLALYPASQQDRTPKDLALAMMKKVNLPRISPCMTSVYLRVSPGVSPSTSVCSSFQCGAPSTGPRRYSHMMMRAFRRRPPPRRKKNRRERTPKKTQRREVRSFVCAEKKLPRRWKNITHDYLYIILLK